MNAKRLESVRDVVELFVDTRVNDDAANVRGPHNHALTLAKGFGITNDT